MAYILREVTGEWLTNGVKRFFRSASLTQEWKTSFTGKNLKYFGFFFQKSYACYSHMEISLTTTTTTTIIIIIIIIIVIIIMFFIKIKSP